MQAVIEGISHYHDSRLKIALCTDLAYVYGGLQGGGGGGGTQVAGQWLGHGTGPGHERGLVEPPNEHVGHNIRCVSLDQSPQSY